MDSEASQHTRWFRVGNSARRRPGETAQAVADQLASVSIDPVRASLARDAADLVDSARRAQDPVRWAAAADRLLRWLGPPAVGGSGDDVARESAVAGDGGDELAVALGAGPEVRDAEDA